MRAVLQRVKAASVEVDGQVVGRISSGLLVFLGIGSDDTVQDIQWMVDKIINLRVFEREKGRMNESLLDMGGEILVVSQFTLYGDCSRGRRPSFSGAMPSGEAKKLFDIFLERISQKVARVESGVFQAYMDVSLINEGPVTMILDSKEVKTVR